MLKNHSAAYLTGFLAARRTLNQFGCDEKGYEEADGNAYQRATRFRGHEPHPGESLVGVHRNAARRGSHRLRSETPPGRAATLVTVRLANGSSCSCSSGARCPTGGQLASFEHMIELRVSTNASPQNLATHAERRHASGSQSPSCRIWPWWRGVQGRPRKSVSCACRVRRLLRPPSASRSLLFALMDAQPTSCARNTSRRREETLARPCTSCAMSTAQAWCMEDLRVLDGHVRGMLRCALYLRNRAAQLRFRRCLKDEIASRLQIMHGRQPVCGAREKSRCSQGAAGSLPERRLAGAAGPVLRGSAPGVRGGPQRRPHLLDLRLVDCALAIAPWVLPSTQTDRVQPRHRRPGHHRSVSLASEHHIPTLRAPRPRLSQV